jgi:hypothetical protein
MTTRSIVTSQPDVACDVCARRLLRGEQPDYFIDAGRRRIVCELCAPRAAHEGWMRESDQGSVTLPPMRPRRGRSLLDRLRVLAKPGEDPTSARRSRRESSRPTPYDLFDPVGEPKEPIEGEDEALPGAASPEHHASAPVTYPERAAEIFNASEFPRRIAGVARSLGTPVVSVRSAEHLSTIVRIVVAWELSWYRYEVDLGEEPAVAVAIGQGTELDELEREEREGNAVALDTGALALAQ